MRDETIDGMRPSMVNAKTCLKLKLVDISLPQDLI